MNFSRHVLLVLLLSQQAQAYNNTESLRIGRILEDLLSYSLGIELFLISSKLPLSAFIQFCEALNAKSVTVYQGKECKPNQLYNLLSRIFSNNEEDYDCHKLYTVIDPEDNIQLAGILKMIGDLEHRRLSHPFLQCAPTIFVVWPSSGGHSVEDLESSLRNITTDTGWRFPVWSSNIYLLAFAKGDGNSSRFEIYELFSWTPPKNAKETNFVLNQISSRSIRNFARHRSDFMSNAIRVTGLDKNSNLTQYRSRYVPQQENRNNLIFGNLTAIGISEPVIELMRDSLNFSIEIVPADNWLIEPENDTRAGLGKLLMDRSADVSIDASTSISFRAKYFTLLVPLLLDRPCIWLRQPSASSVRNIFTQPFSISLWIAIIGLCIVGTGLFAILKIVLRKFPKLFMVIATESDTIGNALERPEYLSIDSTALWFASIVTNQGWYQVPEKVWLRIIFFSGSLMGLIFYTAYSATLVSQFASVSKPIDTLQKFLRSDLPLYGDMHSPVLKNVFVQQTLSYGSLSHKIKFVDRTFALNQTLGIQNQVTPSTQKSVAFLTFTEGFYSASRILLASESADHFFCKHITEIAAIQRPFASGMVVGKNSPLKEHFNHKIIKYYEAGLQYRESKAYVSHYRPRCDSQESQSLIETVSNGLSLADTFSAFVIIFAGAFCALIVLLLELVNSHCIT